MYKQICQLVLRLYPRSFRTEFGEESWLLFRDRWRDERGFFLKVRLCLDIVFDTLTSIIREHGRHDETLGIVRLSTDSAGPTFVQLADVGPSPTALCSGALASAVALLVFSTLLLPAPAAPRVFQHAGFGGLGSWLLRVSHERHSLVRFAATAVKRSGGGATLATIFLPIVQSKPQFDVASIKPATAQGIMFVRPLPGRLTANASLQMLMQNAYGMQAFQILEGPDWVRSDRFAIDATTSGNPPRVSIMMMLQVLLEDRFQLKLRRETRQLPVYSLVNPRTEFKLAPAKDGGCAEAAPNAPADWAGGIMAPPGVRPTSLPVCGTPRVMLTPDGAQMQARRVGMTDLARALSLVMGRNVIDRTGIQGLFDLDLTFLPDETTAAMPPPPPGIAPALDMKTATMFSALQEQLGLRLESAKGPVEVLIIEHADKPRAN